MASLSPKKLEALNKEKERIYAMSSFERSMNFWLLLIFLSVISPRSRHIGALPQRAEGAASAMSSLFEHCQVASESRRSQLSAPRVGRAPQKRQHHVP